MSVVYKDAKIEREKNIMIRDFEDKGIECRLKSIVIWIKFFSDVSYNYCGACKVKK